MSKSFVFLFMLFMHIFSDFTLQGIMREMKQKNWWEEQTKDLLEHEQRFYKNDWIPVLVCHSIEWTFCVMLPIFIYYRFDISYTMLLEFIANVIIHFMVDNAKCNKHSLNLVGDQIIHFFQILITVNVVIS